VPALAKLLSTTTFRLATSYLLVFVLSVGAIFGYVYWSTTVLLERQTDQTIQAELTGLAEQYRQGRLPRLVASVARRTKDPGASVYLVADFADRRVAGNMTRVPPGVDDEAGWTEFPYQVRTPGGLNRHQARAYYTRLAGGFTLIVGRDVQEQREFTRLITRTLAWALALTLALGLGGGLLISRRFLQRIDTINRTSRAIMHGDLSERMPVSGSGDEIDRLSDALNEMLEQIERLMAGMREVSDNVAHDLKSPLTRLRAGIEDALRSNDKRRFRTALETTLAEADNVLKTFEALLSIARAESGEARAAIAAMDLGAVLADVHELYEPAFDDIGGTLRIERHGDLQIAADRHLIAQALSNLIDNALKYADPAKADGQGENLVVTIEARREGDQAMLAVADNGPGIPEGEHERVVERFVRLDESRSQPGSGLGLALVASIAGLHGGSLKIEDNRPGTRAVITFPVVAE